jgi:steroid delta-isomerase-like uncharacterized protein
MKQYEVAITKYILKGEFTMSTEENKALILRMYEEVHNKGNLDVLDEITATDFIDHNLAPGLPSGLDGAKQLFTMFHSAFPDFHVTVEDMIAEEDKVVSRLTMGGTHKGEFMGIPPTGKEVSVEVIDILRINNGKAVERWGIFDQLGLMQQLDVGPLVAQIIA